MSQHKPTFTRTLRNSWSLYITKVLAMNSWIVSASYVCWNWNGVNLRIAIGHRMLQIFRKASGASEEQHNFNPNPAISMATTILRHNKAHSRDFIVQLEQCLQVALVRFDVQTQTLRELLRVTSALYKRAGLDHSATNGTAAKRHANVIINLLVDTLSEVFRSKVRTTPVTLVALVEVKPILVHSNETNFNLFLGLTTKPVSRCRSRLSHTRTRRKPWLRYFAVPSLLRTHGGSSRPRADGITHCFCACSTSNKEWY